MLGSNKFEYCRNIIVGGCSVWRILWVNLSHKFTPEGTRYKDMNWYACVLNKSSYSHDIVSPRTRNILLIYNRWPQGIKMISHSTVGNKFMMYFWYQGINGFCSRCTFVIYCQIISTFTRASLWVNNCLALYYNKPVTCTYKIKNTTNQQNIDNPQTLPCC